MSLPPTENPSSFPNGLDFNPNFYGTEGGDGLSQSIADQRYLLKKAPDTATALETFAGGLSTNSITASQITESLTIGSNLTTGDIVIGTAETETIIQGTLKPTNRIITSGLITPTGSSSCALFNTLQTNSIFIGNQLETGYGIQMGSNNCNILMNGKNIQLGTNAETQSIKCLPPLSVNEIKVLDGTTLDIGKNATDIQIGNELTSSVYLGGAISSSVLVSGDFVCKKMITPASNTLLSLFTNLSTGGINFFTSITEPFINGVLNIGRADNQVRFLASSLTSTQVIAENSYDNTITTTEWVSNYVSNSVGLLFTNLYTGNNAFEGNNTFTKPIILNYSGIGANDTTKLGYCEYYETTPYIALFDGVNSFFKYRKNFPGSPIITGSYLVNVSLTFNVDLDYLKIFISRVKETTPYAPNLAYDTYTGAKEPIDTGTIIIDATTGGNFKANNRVSTSCVVPITSTYDTIAIILNAQPTGGSQECYVLNSWSITRIG